MREIKLFDRQTDTDHQVLTARITDAGDLILEGQDLGPIAKEFWGDDEYEYSRTVTAAHVPAVLLHLISERFQSDTDFKAWLDAKGIASTFFNWP